jgi:hypothetical protein
MNFRAGRPVLVLMRSGCVALTAFALIAAACSPAPESSERPSADAVAELEATGEPLGSGTYTRSGFEPRITFEVGIGWEAVQLFEGFFDVQQEVGSPDVIAVQFARPTDLDDAASALEAMRTAEGLTVIESSESRMGGLTGQQVTVENAADAHATVLAVPPGPLGIDPGRRLWIAFFDTDDGLLAIMVGGSVERWADALEAAEPVLESVRIGP